MDGKRKLTHRQGWARQPADRLTAVVATQMLKARTSRLTNNTPRGIRNVAH
jgi:hypothetical protein